MITCVCVCVLSALQVLVVRALLQLQGLVTALWMMQLLRLSLQPRVNWQALEVPRLSLTPLLQLSLPWLLQLSRPPLRPRLPLLPPQPQPRVRPATPVLQRQSRTRPGVLRPVPPVHPQPQQVQVARQSQQLERRRRSQLHPQVRTAHASDGRLGGMKAKRFSRLVCGLTRPLNLHPPPALTQCWSKVCAAHWV